METLFIEYEPIKETLKLVDLLARIKKPEKREKKKRGITNERQSIIKEFVDEINKERDPVKYKPVTGRQISVMLGVLKSNDELYQFLSECKDYRNRHNSFSKRFFGGFKQKV